MSAFDDRPRMQVPDAALERGRLMLERARWAAAKLAKLDRPAIMAAVDAAAAAGHARAREFAERNKML